MTALTSDQLLAWLEKTSTEWESLLTQRPEALALPCDVIGVTDVAGLMQHIVAVELRYAQALADLPVTPYESILKGCAAELFATHRTAMHILDPLLADTTFDWEQHIEYVTRSVGTIQVSRRAISVHLAMHGIRHYAQLATLVRQHNIKPGWFMDYLFMEAIQS